MLQQGPFKIIFLKKIYNACLLTGHFRHVLGVPYRHSAPKQLAFQARVNVRRIVLVSILVSHGLGDVRASHAFIGYLVQLRRASTQHIWSWSNDQHHAPQQNVHTLSIFSIIIIA